MTQINMQYIRFKDYEPNDYGKNLDQLIISH